MVECNTGKPNLCLKMEKKTILPSMKWTVLFTIHHLVTSPAIIDCWSTYYIDHCRVEHVTYTDINICGCCMHCVFVSNNLLIAESWNIFMKICYRITIDLSNHNTISNTFIIVGLSVFKCTYWFMKTMAKEHGTCKY